MQFQDQTMLKLRGPWGIPVEAGYSVLFLALIVLEVGKPMNLFIYDLMFLALLFLSIYLHELGHAWAAHVQGLGVERISLNGAGGFCEQSREGTRWQQEFVVAMGPLVNLAIWAQASLLAQMIPDPELAWVFAALAWINLYLGIFNLIPVMPLDGGKLLRLILLRLLPEPAAERAAGLVGLAVAVVWVPLLLLGFLMTGLILFFLPSIPDHWKMVRGAA